MKRPVHNAWLVILAALWTGSVAAAAMTPIQARKELTSMGLNYADAKQFLAAVTRNDDVALELFVAARGIDLNSADLKVENDTLFRYFYDKGHKRAAELVRAGGYQIRSTDLRAMVRKKDLGTIGAILTEKEFNKGAIDPYVIADAIDAQEPEIMRVLLGRLGDAARQVVNTQGQYGKWGTRREVEDGHRRLLNYAISASDKEEMITILVSHGADVNAVDPKMCWWTPPALFDQSKKTLQRCPETPLMTAAHYLRPKVVEAIIKNGARINEVVVQDGGLLKPYYRHTALSYVMDSPVAKPAKNKPWQEETIRVLREAGAKEPGDASEQTAFR